jgi:hypothetical protein
LQQDRITFNMNLRRSAALYATLACATLSLWLVGCATPEVAPKPAPVRPVIAAPVVPPAPPPVQPPPVAPEPPPPLPIEMPIPSKDATLVELPAYAKRGRRLPADGGDPGRVVMAYCRSFEIERDAQSYFKRLQRDKQLPSAQAVATRSREAGQTLTIEQVVERDRVIQIENAKLSPQRCKVLGGSVDKGVAVIVLDADLNGKRRRGSATVVPVNGKWRVQDHGDWVVIK